MLNTVIESHINMRICVFCGSSPGLKPEYLQAAHALGTEIARRGFGLVYGGASIGLMGEVANAALNAGGDVIGVIPKFLSDYEISHTGLTELHITTSMHERKTKMAELSDAFAVLPGGIGTLEETFEIATWAQLGLHQKPIGLLNVENYYDGLKGFLDHQVQEKFVKPAHRDLLIFEKQAGQLIDRLISSPIQAGLSSKVT